MAATKKRKAKAAKVVKTVKKENPVDLIQKKPNAFMVGSIALILGAIAGIVLVQQRTPQPKSTNNSVVITPSMMQQKQDKQKEKFTEYTMQENESLSDVAQRFYNDPNLYTKIAQENNLDNPDMVAPGTKLKLYNLPQ